MELPPLGSIFAGHRLDGVAGRGGMGVVYRATDQRLERTVALKLIVPDLSRDPGFRLRFERESRTAASIRHPHVITVFHAGEEAGLLYVTMDFIEGTDLAALLKTQGPLAPAAAAGLLSQVGSALDAAHARGLVHRDVKPANVLVETAQGGSKAILTDFGLTKLVASQTTVTETGMFVGTIDYIAPEQLEGRMIDARTDVYALGCVLYHVLTGRVPYPRDTQLAKLYAHASAAPPSILSVDPTLPAELDHVVKRAMAKSPEDRYPSAGDLAHAAVGAAGGRRTERVERSVARGEAATGAAPTPPAPPPEPPAPPPRRSPEPPEPPRSPSPSRGRRTLLIGGGAALAVAAVAVALVLTLGGDDGGGNAGKKPAQRAEEPAAEEPQANRTIPAGAVANVGDAHITKEDFDHWRAAAAKQTKLGSGKPTDTNDQTMQFLISAEWLAQEAAKRGVTASDEEVAGKFEEQKKQSFPKEAGYQRFLERSGQTEEDLLFRVKLSVLTEELQAKVTDDAPAITDADIADYYEENKDRFQQPELRDLLVVLAGTQARAEQARGELESGAPFARVARQFSLDAASRSQGGKLPAVAKGEQEKAFDRAIFNAAKGDLVGPVKTQFGYYVFQVTRVERGKSQSLADASDTIQKLLQSRNEQEELNEFVKDFTKRYTAATWCAPGYVIKQCANAKATDPAPPASPLPGIGP
jgi:serine/threonine protein kinase/parvulin-like peptidyl-prolyl isomerase